MFANSAGQGEEKYNNTDIVSLSLGISECWLAGGYQLQLVRREVTVWT